MRFIRSKFSLLILLTAIIFIVSLTAVILHNFYTLKTVKNMYSIQLSTTIKKSFEMQSRMSEKYLRISTSNPTFFPCNILSNNLQLSRIDMPGFDYIAVADSALFPLAVYPFNKINFVTLLPNSATEMKKLMSDGTITRFYGWINNDLVRISCIKIPWCEEAHSNEYGWLFAGEIIEKSEAVFASAMIGGNVTVTQEPVSIKNSDQKASSGKKIIRTSIPVYGRHNLPVASFNAETYSKPQDEIEKYQSRLILILIIFLVSFLIFLTLYLRRYYILPLKMINLAFKFRDPEMLKITKNNDKDFNSLQLFMMNIFSQESLLNDMIRYRTTDNLNSFHAALLYQISDAVFATDHNHVITYWNSSAEALYGIPERDAITKQADILIVSRWANKKEKEYHENQLQTNGIMRGKMLQTTPNGSELLVDAVITQLHDCNGVLIGQLNVFRKSD
jgi:PAS domain S-box-containing protein